MLRRRAAGPERRKLVKSYQSFLPALQTPSLLKKTHSFSLRNGSLFSTTQQSSSRPTSAYSFYTNRPSISQRSQAFMEENPSLQR